MNDDRHTPELMAPAGDMNAAMAAFDAGADAVYAGLPAFNARQRAVNFEPPQLAGLAAWARQHGRKVYVTFNTLIKETELAAAADVLGQIDNICPHAVIVQDLGAMRIMRHFFPHIPVHASTQAGCHNSAGVEMLSALGAKRVILERQVTLDELAAIRRRTSLELEVFVHGALCCSLSGRCLLSSWMGGWSGNRGRCKQPCRRRFFAEGGNGFFFSTRDLYALDVLDRLAAMGIDALKIEGRLREPAYVAGTVRACRMVLDAATGEREAAIREARGLLGRTGGRKWSPGFRRREDFATVVDHRVPGGSGALCGKVQRVASNGFYIRPSRAIRAGDTIRLQPPSAEAGPSLVVTMISADGGTRLARLPKSTRGFIHCDKDVEPGSAVYITARKSGDYAERAAAVPAVAKTLALDVAVDAGGIAVRLLNVPGALSWRKDMAIPPARKVSLSPEKVAKEFRKIVAGDRRAAAVAVAVGEGLFLQDKLLRQARQAYAAWLKEQGVFGDGNLDSPGRIALLDDLERPEKDEHRSGEIQRTVRRNGGSDGHGSGAVTAVDMASDVAGADEVILPAFCAEPDGAGMTDRVRELRDAGVTRFRMTSLWQFGLFTGRCRERVRIAASFPLPACNRYAVRELLELGAEKVMLWPELDRAAFASLARRFGGTVEVFTSGRLPLLATRAALAVAGQIAGGRGQKFTVAREGDLALLYPETALSIPPQPGAAVYRDATGPAAAGSSDFNYGREWL